MVWVTQDGIVVNTKLHYSKGEINTLRFFIIFMDGKNCKPESIFKVFGFSSRYVIDKKHYLFASANTNNLINLNMKLKDFFNEASPRIYYMTNEGLLVDEKEEKES